MGVSRPLLLDCSGFAPGKKDAGQDEDQPEKQIGRQRFAEEERPPQHGRDGHEVGDEGGKLGAADADQVVEQQVRHTGTQAAQTDEGEQDVGACQVDPRRRLEREGGNEGAERTDDEGGHRRFVQGRLVSR